jgi:predicted Zn-dependent peptidase
MKIFPAMFLVAAPWLLAHDQLRVTLPPHTRDVLPNGAVIYVVPRKDAALIDVRAVIRGGAESDPQGLEGLSSVVAAMLHHGTATRTVDAFADEVDGIGATFDAWADRQSTVISMEFLSSHRERALDLFSDAILHPSFPIPEVRKVVAQSTDAAKSTKDSPAQAAALYFRSFLFGPNHPYGHPVEGDEVSLQRVGRSAIAAYYRRLYVGPNLTIVAVGNFESSEMRQRLAKSFGQLPSGVRYEWIETPPQDPPADPRLLLVDRPGSSQTQFVIGWPGISRTDKDRLAVWLVNTVFGGGFTSMLNSTLRIHAGLTYGANCVFDQNRLTGAISIRSSASPQFTAQAVDLALAVLLRLRDKGITADELTTAKTNLKGNYPSDYLETPDQAATLFSELELFGLQPNDVDDLFDRIDAVSLDEANAAARKYFSGRGLVFVLLGDAAQVRQIARRYVIQPWETSISGAGYAVFERREREGVDLGSQLSAAHSAVPVH